jgi:hypothetical protein
MSQYLAAMAARVPKSPTIPSNCLVPPTLQYECGICKETALEPANTKCGHIYCVSCLAEHVKRSDNKCPEDRKQIVPGKIVEANTMLGAIIGRLDARCPHTGTNDILCECEWKGVVSQVNPHLKECPMVMVQCPHGCGQTLPGDAMKEHAKDYCEKRTVDCKVCGKKLQLSEVDNHTSGVYKCRSFVHCPRDCKTEDYVDVAKYALNDAHKKLLTLPRMISFPVPDNVADKAKHAKVCVKTLLVCCMCNTEYLRGEHAKHMKNYTVTHISSLHKRVHVAIDRAEAAERELKRVKQEVEQLKKGGGKAATSSNSGSFLVASSSRSSPPPAADDDDDDEGTMFTL